ncbi:MAG: hypothetical protein AAB410_02155 [Patescibacteria group bacterium]
MKLEFYNCPSPRELDPSILPKDVGFLSYQPDFKLMEDYAKTYMNFQNILIIGNGGSINPLIGIYHPLKHQAKKELYILSTQDPDYIYALKQKLKPDDTLVISISKSGENIQQIEETMQFVEYPMLMITGRSSPLRALGEKLGCKIIMHPPIGGRFTGFTEVALLPAALCGLEVKALYEGAEEIYLLYDRDNLAWKTASIFFQLEQKGFLDVLMFFYAQALYPANYPMVQLCHESFGKDGKGQSYFAHEGPEVQHHTTQRFYGGPKNISGMFFTVENFLHPTVNTFPVAAHSVQIKGHPLFDLDKIPLEKALEYEWTANIEDARIQGIPLAHFSLTGFQAKEIGRLSALWQLFAVYSSMLRDVNPFDQPQVENSKNISFNKRLQFKGFL